MSSHGNWNGNGNGTGVRGGRFVPRWQLRAAAIAIRDMKNGSNGGSTTTGRSAEAK